MSFTVHADDFVLKSFRRSWFNFYSTHNIRYYIYLIHVRFPFFCTRNKSVGRETKGADLNTIYIYRVPNKSITTVILCKYIIVDSIEAIRLPSVNARFSESNVFCMGTSYHRVLKYNVLLYTCADRGIRRDLPCRLHSAGRPPCSVRNSSQIACAR